MISKLIGYGCLILIANFLLAGCVKQNILDDVQAVTALGFDLEKDKRIKVTAVVPIYQPDKIIKNDVYTGVSTLSKQVRDLLNARSPLPFVSGKIEVVLYSKELAEKGVAPYLDTLTRDPSIGTNVYLAVVDGVTQPILEKQIGDHDNGVYLSNLIEHNIKSGIMPKTNLHLFMYAFYSEGQDPFIPELKPVGQRVGIDGIALFKDDKMVGRLAREDLFIFKSILLKKASDGSLLIKVGENDYASIYNVNSVRAYKVDGWEGMKLTIQLKMNANILEYSGEVLNDEVTNDIEKEMEEQVKKRAEELVAAFQELEVDPLGLGDYMRSKDRSWDKSEWADRYPHMEITFDVGVDITETGVTE